MFKRIKLGKVFIIISITITMICYIVFYYNNVSIWEKMSFEYLVNRYDVIFHMVGSQRNGRMIIVTYQTTDEYQIKFDVTCSLGGLYTPWGTISFIPKRHFRDDFAERINDKIIGDEKEVDMNNYSLDDMVKFFKDKSQKIKNIYDKYGLKSTPNFEIRIYHNGHSELIHYISQDDEILRDFLIRSFSFNM